MDATKRSPTQLDVNPGPILADHERRMRARVMMRAALAAMDAYERAIRADLDHARSLIAEVEGWLGGAPEPELFATWRRLHRDLFAVVDTQTPTALNAQANYEQDFVGSLGLTDAAISAVLCNATGVNTYPLADNVRVMRGELISEAGGDTNLADDVAELFDAACARIVGLPEDARKHLETIEVAP